MKTLIENQAWVIEDFLSEDDYTSLTNQLVMDNTEMTHINNINTKPLMYDTDMSYRVKTIPHFQPIYNSIEQNLNIKLPKPQYRLNMQYKRFLDDDSYGLHAENKDIFGEYAYIMYLTDEEDGYIILPSKKDHRPSDGFKEMQEMFEITFASKTVSYLPKKNTCLIMRTGIAHMVTPCTGRRDNITGWPFFGEHNG
jgi:hypothetical protein